MANVKVRYKGASDVRILPVDELVERGVKGIDKDLVFKPENMWAQEVPMTDELEAILRNDGAFTFEPVKDDGSTSVTDPGDPLQTSVEGVDDTGNTVVDGDTGQTEENKHPLAEEEVAEPAEPEEPDDEKAPLASESGDTAGPDTVTAKGK